MLFSYRTLGSCVRTTAALGCLSAMLLSADAVLGANPSISNIAPVGAKRGTEIEVQINGQRIGDAQELLLYYPGITVKKVEPIKDKAGTVNDNAFKAVLAIAPDCRLGNHAVRVRTATGLTDMPVLFSVGALEEIVEKEPNSEFATPQEIPLDVTVNGTIGGEDVDYFVVQAKKGERITAEVEGTRLGRQFDSYLAILDADRFELARSDDSALMWYDSLASIVAPADGKYVVEVRDLHLRGGDAFGYALKLSRGTPHFLLHADLDKVLIPAGVGGQVFVKVLRKNNFTGEIDLRVEGLPKGVRAECGRILADGQDGCICFYAEPGVKPCAAIARIVGSAVYKDPNGKESKLTAVAAPWQETYLPGGGRGHYPVDAFFISVCEPLDVLKVSVSPTDVVLKPGESKKIEITVERAAGFDKNLTLDLIYRHLASPFGNSLPAGVTIDDKQSKTLLTAKETKGHITLVAAKDAKPVDRQIVPVMSQAAINFVMKMSYCGDPLRVTVTK